MILLQEFNSDMMNHKQPHIVILAARGDAVRTFLYSRMLDILNEKADVTILTTTKDKRIISFLQEKCNRILSLDAGQENKIVLEVRQILEYSHERYIWSQPAQARWRKRDYRYKRPADRVKWLISRTCAQILGNPLGLRALSKLERWLSHYLQPTEQYVNLWKELKPDLVFNCSHIHNPATNLPLQAAEKLGIKTATFVFSWDNLTSRGRIFLNYDHFLLWNEKMCHQLLALYSHLRLEQTTITGTPQFDYHLDSQYLLTREEFCNQVGADPKRPIVLYTTGIPKTMPEEQRIVAGIASLISNMKDFGPPQLIVRIYYKDQTNRFDGLRATLPDVIFSPALVDADFIPYYEDVFLLTNLLHHASVGINVASTVSLELAIFNKPIINVAYNPPDVDITPVDYTKYYHFDHYRPLVESRVVQLAQNEIQMAELLHEALLCPGKYEKERQRFIKEFFGPFLDGQASERVGHTLLDLTKERI